MNRLVTFENTYLCTHQKDGNQEDGDIYASISIDGFPMDENEEGEVVAEVFCSIHGDIIVSWHNNAYRLNQSVIALIQESKKTLLDMYKVH